MCGVLATTVDSLFRTPNWTEALRVLECRGPDSCGEAHAAEVSMGHRRLEVIGLGAPGRQPYQLNSSGDSLVYNGEILNYREIAQELGIAPDSDTHVLFELLRRGDYSKLARLRGMYAFVFWSAERDHLVSARDPMGIKPLYVRTGDPEELSFASVAGALAKLHDIREANGPGLAHFLAAGHFPSPLCAFSGVEKLPPGQVVTWSRVGPHWRASRQQISVSNWPTLSVSHALADSVSAHLTSDVPVGVLMSGGIDSTLIATLAVKENPDIATYSLTNPDNPDIDESEFAAWNAGLLGTRHIEVPVTPSELASHAGGLIATSGEPFGDAGFLPLSALCEVVARETKVVLAGEGADELFGGYRRYSVERVIAAPRLGPLTRLGARLGGGRHRYTAAEPTQRRRTLAAMSAGPGHASHSYLLGGDWDTVVLALPATGANALSSAQAGWQALSRHPLSQGIPRYRGYDLATWLPNVYMEKSDRASMRHGVEVRVPFMDPVVTRSALSLDIRDSKKTPLKSLLQHELPGVRLPRAKMGLSVALAQVLDDPTFQQYLKVELSGSGVLGQFEAVDLRSLRNRAATSASFAFRITTVGAWAEQWGIRAVSSG